MQFLTGIGEKKDQNFFLFNRFDRACVPGAIVTQKTGTSLADLLTGRSAPKGSRNRTMASTILMVVSSFFPLRIAAWILVLIMQGLLLTMGCIPSSEAAPPRGTAVVIFVDFSGSVRSEARALFKREIDTQILPSLSAGDRILIAAINDKTLTEFRPLVEATLPAKPEFNGWLDNVLKYNRRVKDIDAEVVQLKEQIRAQVADVMASREASPLTDIFSSLLIAEKLFHNEPRRKVLVLMSDMIEDFPPYYPDFEKVSWSPTTIQKILSELDAKGFIPKLSDVCVYVSGVSARSPEMAEHIGRFWQAYFQQTKADMDPSRYAHVLLHWPPSKSCRLQ